MTPVNWIEAAAQLSQRGSAYTLITVLNVKGSAPRDAGTKMLVTDVTTVGSIGGGHLEFSAIAQARQLLTQGRDQQLSEDYPLGAKLGQCCGGRVTLLFEVFAATALPVYLFGAGHVARALVGLLSHLPVKVQWIDSRAGEFPVEIPIGIQRVIAEQPEDQVLEMPAGAYVLAMTHLHPLDYAICEAVLRRRDASYLGVIGSQTKAQRFRLRLQHRGFSASDIEFMHCPVGLSAVPGKRPMEIAVAVAADIIRFYHRHTHGQNQRIGQTPALLNKLDKLDNEDAG